MSSNAEPITEEDNVGEDALSTARIVDSAIADGVLDEKCVVAIYKTTVEQRDAFAKHLETCPRNYIPVEWVIDIADESNGWFYGTAYHFDDTTQMLHVMVPDKENPSFDGSVFLDYRTVHLVECVDGYSEALFNKIVRNSVVRVRWELEWFEELPPEAVNDSNFEIAENYAGAKGRYITSTARYFVRMANQLLVEDEGFGEDNKGFVMLTADLNVRLRWCHKGKGAEDFIRLIQDNLTQGGPDAIASADVALSAGSNAIAVDAADKPAASSSVPTKKLAEMTRSLRENLASVLDERERLHEDRKKLSKIFTSFALDGDLDSGMKLLNFSNEVDAKEKNRDPMDSTVEDTWALCQKLEKGMVKLLKSTETDSGVQGGRQQQQADPSTMAAGATADNSAEMEYLRRTQRKMKKELDERSKEVELLRAQLAVK